MTRLTLPSVANTGRSSHMPTMATATTATAEAAWRAVARSASRTSAISIISTAPTPIAATRTESCSSSAGVVISHWSLMYSHEGDRISSTKTMTISALTVSTQVRHCGRNRSDEGGEAHVLAAPQRDHGAQHREPQKQQRREFVRPRQRLVEDVARDDARRTG